jgi:hypothetical protein
MSPMVVPETAVSFRITLEIFRAITQDEEILSPSSIIEYLNF